MTPSPMQNSALIKRVRSSLSTSLVDSRSISGFTFFEVLIALVIFLIGTAVLTQSFVNIIMSLESIESTSNVQTDLRFVRAQALRITDREEFEEGGDMATLSSGRATWYASIESTAVSDLFRVLLTIELSAPEMRDSTVHEQTLYLLRPTWSDPLERSELIAENRDRLEASRLTADW